MDPVTIGMLGLSGAGLIGNLIGQGNAVDASREKLNFDKWAYQNAMAREDNAVQRRVADLRAAGLSPTLAAGSAAQSMAPISIGQQQTVDPSAAMAASIQPVLAMSQLRQTQAQTAATYAQAQNTEYETLSKNWHDKITQAMLPADFQKKLADIDSVRAGTSNTSAMAGMNWDDFARQRKSGQRRGSIGGDLYDTTQKVGGLVEQTGEAIKGLSPFQQQQDLMKEYYRKMKGGK